MHSIRICPCTSFSDQDYSLLYAEVVSLLIIDAGAASNFYRRERKAR